MIRKFLLATGLNVARGWTGHLWANRFYSTPLDEAHLWTAIRYVELNPVRAGLVARAEEWEWSSARVHCGMEAAEGDGLAAAVLAADRPFGGSRPDGLTGAPVGWSEWLARGVEEDAVRRLRAATMTGRPCGGEDFVRGLEARLGRSLGPKKPGPKPKAKVDDDQMELFQNEL